MEGLGLIITFSIVGLVIGLFAFNYKPPKTQGTIQLERLRDQYAMAVVVGVLSSDAGLSDEQMESGAMPWNHPKHSGNLAKRVFDITEALIIERGRRLEVEG